MFAKRGRRAIPRNLLWSLDVTGECQREAQVKGSRAKDGRAVAKRGVDACRRGRQASRTSPASAKDFAICADLGIDAVRHHHNSRIFYVSITCRHVNLHGATSAAVCPSATRRLRLSQQSGQPIHEHTTILRSGQRTRPRRHGWQTRIASCCSRRRRRRHCASRADARGPLTGWPLRCASSTLQRSRYSTRRWKTTSWTS